MCFIEIPQREELDGAEDPVAQAVLRRVPCQEIIDYDLQNIQALHVHQQHAGGDKQDTLPMWRANRVLSRNPVR